jgi:hypothetical protein
MDTLLQALTKVSPNRIFTVTFVKRTTGEVRVMNCRKASVSGSAGVRKGQKTGKPVYDFAEHDLLCVYDMKANGYRSINLRDVRSAKIDGVNYV